MQYITETAILILAQQPHVTAELVGETELREGRFREIVQEIQDENKGYITEGNATHFSVTLAGQCPLFHTQTYAVQKYAVKKTKGQSDYQGGPG